VCEDGLFYTYIYSSGNCEYIIKIILKVHSLEDII
jgi:hypothetical protein